MTYVPPVYPTTIPTIADLPDRVDDVDWLEAARYNELKKELRACLTELGTNPKGSYATVKARLDNISLVLKQDAIGLSNLISNGDFDIWSLGAASQPDLWVPGGAGAGSAQESTIIKVGPYSYALTRNGTDAYAYQTNLHVDKSIAYWQGRTVTFGCWVLANESDTVRLFVADGKSPTFSAYHSGGGGWELLTGTKTIASDATQLTLYLTVYTTDQTGYFSGAMMVEGNLLFSFSPKLLPRGGIIAAETDETKFSHKIPVLIDGTLYYIMLTQS